MRSITRAGSVALALLIGACSGGPARIAAGPPPIATAPGEIDAIDALLLRGEDKAARKRLKAVLKRDPMNAQAQLLRDSIERDPQDLLGPQSYPYTVRAGDTIAGLAQKTLGNRLKALQLARYNGLSAPYALTPGQSLRIPGSAPRSEPVRRPAPPPPRPKPSTGTAVPVAPKPTPAKPPVPAANPAAARQFRTAGLAALNQGNVARAVGLLRRAAAVDPGNPLIRRDLARAERIAATVRARK